MKIFKLIITTLLIGGLLVFGLFKFTPSRWEAKLVSPLAKVFQPKVVVTPSPGVTSRPSPKPKTFQFNNATDLKIELDTVNPQVLDSDFDE